MTDVPDPSRSQDARGSRRDPFSTFLTVACLVLAALAIHLAVENRRLKRQLSGAHEALPDDALRAGDALGTLELRDADGASVRIDFDGESPRTLLLVFSSTCPACERNMAHWLQLLTGPLDPGLRVVGLRTDGPAVDVTDPAPRFPVYALDGAPPASLARIPFVPATILLDARGTIVDAWFGVLAPDQREALARELSSTPPMQGG